jgi:putative FmdB family regulatory protein
LNCYSLKDFQSEERELKNFRRFQKMPIYEYKCKKCGEHSEYIQKFSDSPMTDCKACGTAEALEKLMSLGSFHLKGSGWYLTDYARKNSPTNSSIESGKSEPKKTETTMTTASTTTTEGTTKDKV